MLAAVSSFRICRHPDNMTKLQISMTTEMCKQLKQQFYTLGVIFASTAVTFFVLRYKAQQTEQCSPKVRKAPWKRSRYIIVYLWRRTECWGHESFFLFCARHTPGLSIQNNIWRALHSLRFPILCRQLFYDATIIKCATVQQHKVVMLYRHHLVDRRKFSMSRTCIQKMSAQSGKMCISIQGPFSRFKFCVQHHTQQWMKDTLNI